MLSTSPTRTGAYAGSSTRRPVTLTSSVCPPKYREVVGSYTFTGRFCRIRNPRRRSVQARLASNSTTAGCRIGSLKSNMATLPSSYPLPPPCPFRFIGAARRELGGNLRPAPSHHLSDTKAPRREADRPEPTREG